MLAVRVRFKKEGRAKYISHLDLNRCMSRAIRRAGLPVWNTQGFNPHPYITFALPLSIFSESSCEVMDTKFDGEMDFEEAARRLNAQMPEGIEITSVAELQMAAKDVAFAQYEITLEYDLGPDSAVTENKLREIIQRMRALDAILIEKQTKRHTVELDVKEYFDKAQIEANGSALIITAVLPASPNENLNPSCFANAISRAAGISPKLDHVRRTQIYNAQMELFV